MGAKTDPLRSVEPEDFLKFKRNLENFLGAKQHWNGDNKKRHLRSLLQDDAALIAAGVNFSIGDNAVAFDTVLERVEAKFLAGRGTSQAHVDFINATQRAAESLHAWSGRLLDIHQRAYPDMNDQARNTSEHLLNQFIVGINNSELRSSVLAWNHATYHDLLINSCRAEAILVSVRRARGGGPSLNSIDAPESAPRPDSVSSMTEPLRCHLCNEIGHFLRDCELYKKARELQSRGRGRGSFRRGRGSFKPRNRGGFKSSGRGLRNSSSRGRNYGVNALSSDTSILDALREDDEETESAGNA